MSEHHCIAQEFLREVHCLYLGWEKLGRAASRTINRGNATGEGGFPLSRNFYVRKS